MSVRPEEAHPVHLSERPGDVRNGAERPVDEHVANALVAKGERRAADLHIPDGRFLRFHKFVFSQDIVYAVGVPRDGEITFADHAGRFYARRYGMAPVVGRLLGYLAVCEPREQSIGELADALLASRSAIAGAVSTLENLGLIRRSRAAGERMDRVYIDLSSPRAMGFDLTEYQEQGELAREGLRLLSDAPPERRAVLLEWASFADFLVDRLPVLEKEWKQLREALHAAGELPDPPAAHRGGGA
jgi:DNA-binding MarR family transcriptional regulator